MGHRNNSKSPGCVTWAGIDLTALSYNYNLAKNYSKNSIIIPMVKANAYGHGAFETAQWLIRKHGVKHLGVARVNEGAALRRQGIKNASIIILGGFASGEAADIVKYSLEPSVFNTSELKALESAAAKRGRRVGVHLKINTGMNRLGVRPHDAAAMINRINKSKHLQLKGIYTHFANADMPKDTFTDKQVALFDAALQYAGGAMAHAANSAAIVKYPFARYDAVRPGIMLYGSSADMGLLKKSKVKPVMELHATVIHTINLKRGEGVSYGGTYRAKSKEKIAIISIGYGDGFRRELSGKWKVMIKEKKYPVVGRVCMDMTAIKIGSAVKEGDDVLVFGKGLPVEEMAKTCGTISYEIFTGITERVERVYKC